MDVLVQKLQKAGYYEPLFKSAFGNASITPERIGSAIGQFVNSMVGVGAKARQVEGNSWTQDITVPNTFTASEAEGARLFFGKALCGNCHVVNDGTFSFLFSQQFADIGLDVNPTDLGAGEINVNQLGMFKIPSLDNIAKTAPYMHDGRFATLDDVINHYNEKIQPSKKLSWELKDFEGNPVRLRLTEEEKKDLKAFLLTFTDHAMLSDKKFSDPFRQ
jgi:cytochrome c peroxidase